MSNEPILSEMRSLRGEEDADIGPHSMHYIAKELHEGMDYVLIVPEGPASYRAFVWYRADTENLA